MGAAAIANALDPDVVVIGGYLRPAEPWVLGHARAAFAERSLYSADLNARLVMSELAESRVPPEECNPF